MAGRLSVFVAVVLVMCAEFPRSNGFQWLEPTTSSIKSAPQVQQSVVYYPMASSVSVTMKWKWRLSGSEAFSGVFIKRHKVNDELNTEVHVASYLITEEYGASETFNSTYYSQQASTGKDAGNITFTIKNITKQTKNKDGGAVNVLSLDSDYVFTCELNIANSNRIRRTSAIKLIVNEKPKITTPPQSQYIKGAYNYVNLKCIATGKPKPVITWEIKKTGGLRWRRYGPQIWIYSFTRDDVGVYKCKAKNVYGEDTAEAFLQYSASEPTTYAITYTQGHPINRRTPAAGRRGTSSGGGGLSTGATVAIVVVFSIIFILIIVGIIVCILRRKPAAPLNNQLPTIHGEQDTPSERRPQYNTAFETEQRPRLPVTFNEPLPPPSLLPPYSPAFETEQRPRLPVIPNEPPPPYEMPKSVGTALAIT